MSIHLHSKAHVHELTTTFCDNRPLYPVVLLAFFSALVWQTLRWQRSHQLGGVELAWVQVSEMTITVLVTYRPPLYWLHSLLYCITKLMGSACTLHPVAAPVTTHKVASQAL